MPLKIEVDAIDFVRDNSDFLLSLFDRIYFEHNPDAFACCSKYLQCSDALSCVETDRELCSLCRYSRNLAQGMVFYGKNSVIAADGTFSTERINQNLSAIQARKTSARRFIVLDTETANFEPTSICQLGIVVLENSVIIDRREYLIKPQPFEFIERFTALHGITADAVLDAPEFPEVWNTISDLFDKSTPCIAHNASFDFGHLKATFEYYGIMPPSFPILDTLAYARHSELSVDNNKLSTLCKYFGIKNEAAHTALSDAAATAELFIKLVALNNDTFNGIIDKAFYKSFEEVGTAKDDVLVCNPARKHNRLNPRDVKPTTEVINDHDKTSLFGKTVVISGALSSMERSKAWQCIANSGGICANSVTKKTDYLVTNANTMTGKLKKAIEYQMKGINIQIINEETFLAMIGWDDD